jgi:uncharacterized membrane protein
MNEEKIVVDISNGLFLIPALTGIIFLLMGFVLLKYPPKTINSLYGYRTVNSMKSQERWNFSQQFSAKEMMKWGAILILISVSGLILHPTPGIAFTSGIILIIGAAIRLMIKTEKAIQSKFKNG